MPSPLLASFRRALEHINADHLVLGRIYRIHYEEYYVGTDNKRWGLKYCHEDGNSWPCKTIRAFEETYPLEVV